MTKKNEVPEVGDAAILYGESCNIEDVTVVDRTRLVRRRRENYEQTLVHLTPPGHPALALEVEAFYRLKGGEWTTSSGVRTRQSSFRWSRNFMRLRRSTCGWVISMETTRSIFPISRCSRSASEFAEQRMPWAAPRNPGRPPIWTVTWTWTFMIS